MTTDTQANRYRERAGRETQAEKDSQEKDRQEEGQTRDRQTREKKTRKTVGESGPTKQNKKGGRHETEEDARGHKRSTDGGTKNDEDEDARAQRETVEDTIATHTWRGAVKYCCCY